MAKNKINKKTLEDVHVSKFGFFKLVVKDFLTERRSWGKLVFDFDLGGRIPPPKPHNF